jgi:hypothetical protein
MAYTTLENANCPRTLCNENAIIEIVGWEPCITSGDIARDLGLAQQRNLRRNFDYQLLFPYYSTRSKNLFPDDNSVWIQFTRSERLRFQTGHKPEGKFKFTTVTFGHGIIITRSTNTHITSASASACGLEILGTLLLVPSPHPQTANWQGDFSQTPRNSGKYSKVQLEDITRTARQVLWFQHNAALSYYGRDIQQWWNATFPGRWIRGTGSITLPLRWPQLNVIKFSRGAPEGASLLYPFQDYRRFRGRIQTAVTTLVANVRGRI